MPNSPIRTFLFGLENVPEIPANVVKTIYTDVESAPTSKDMFARELIRVHNGTMVGATLRALGTRHSTLTLTNLPIFSDQTAWLFASYFGLPTSTQIGTTGVYQHEFKLGPASEPKTGTLYFYNGVRWKRMVGSVTSTLKITGAKEKSPRMDIEFLGHAAEGLEAPVEFGQGSGTVTRKAVAHGTIVAGVITAIVVDDPGAGYAGTVTASVPTSVAHATAAVLANAVLVSGGVSTVAVTSGGTGYVPAPVAGSGIPVYFSRGTGTVTAVARAHAVLTAGVITSVVVDDGGLGYAGTITATVDPTVDHTTAAVLGAVTLTSTAVTAVAVTSGGTGYVALSGVEDDYGPVSFRHLLGTVNAIISDVMSYTLTLNNNRAGRWTGRASADVRRFTRGLADNSFESLYDYVSYGGSYKSFYDQEQDLGDWLAEYINTGINIGSGTDNPEFSIQVPDVIVEDTDEPDDGPEAVQSITGQGTYASSAATSVVITVKNTVGSYAAS